MIPAPTREEREQWNVNNTPGVSVQDVSCDFERLRSQEEPWSPTRRKTEDTAHRRIACEN